MSEYIQGEWPVLKALLAKQWPTLTETDLRMTSNRYEELFVRISARTGEPVAKIEQIVRELPGYDPRGGNDNMVAAPEWSVTQAELKKRWPHLTDADLAQGKQTEVAQRIQQRTGEPLTSINAELAKMAGFKPGVSYVFSGTNAAVYDPVRPQGGGSAIGLTGRNADDLTNTGGAYGHSGTHPYSGPGAQPFHQHGHHGQRHS